MRVHPLGVQARVHELEPLPGRAGNAAGWVEPVPGEVLDLGPAAGFEEGEFFGDEGGPVGYDED